MKFKEYSEMSDNCKKDIEKTLKKVPREHAKLIKDYKIIFEPLNALKNDKNHIGLIDEKNKTITIAAPWNYSREFTLLHELGHAVWKYFVTDQNKEKWKILLKDVKEKNKKDLNQNEEEIFCMIYAQIYAKNKLEKYDHKVLIDFVCEL